MNQVVLTGLKTFCTILKATEAVLSQVKFYFFTDRLYFQGMDSSHVMLIELVLQAEFFDSYKVEEKTEIELPLPTLNKMFNKADDKSTLKIEFESESDHCKFTIISAKKTSVYTVMAIDNKNQDDDYIQPPEMKSMCKFEMLSSDYKDLCAELKDVGDTMSIIATENGLIFKCSGEQTTASLECLKRDEKDEDSDGLLLSLNYNHEEPMLRSDYALKLLEVSSKSYSHLKRVEISMCDKQPLHISYPIANNGKQLGRLSYYLASKLVEETSE